MKANLSKYIPHIIQQHAEETAILWNIRKAQVVAPHVKLHHLRRLDDRIAAHLDGLSVAGEYGINVCEAALEDAGAGEIFAATVRAIEESDTKWLNQLCAIASTAPNVTPGLISAFGWVSAQYLKGIVASFLLSNDPFKQRIGITACVMHRVNPGPILAQCLSNSDLDLKVTALRAVGEAGRRDLLAICESYLTDNNPASQFWAAWSVLLLGNKPSSIDTLRQFALTKNTFQDQSLKIMLCTLPIPEAHTLLKTLAQNPIHIRSLISGSGIAGDPYYVPWLIKQMDDPKLARLAGEAFSLITGLDLAYLDLEQNAPEDLDLIPSENAEDEAVSMDADDNLPWPDPEKIKQWWITNQTKFQSGMRYFLGKSVTHDHCIYALKGSFQRQRLLAAIHLCLLSPGTQIFPTAAPAWRQKRTLERM